MGQPPRFIFGPGESKTGGRIGTYAAIDQRGGWGPHYFLGGGRMCYSLIFGKLFILRSIVQVFHSLLAETAKLHSRSARSGNGCFCCIAELKRENAFKGASDGDFYGRARGEIVGKVGGGGRRNTKRHWNCNCYGCGEGAKIKRKRHCSFTAPRINGEKKLFCSAPPFSSRFAEFISPLFCAGKSARAIREKSRKKRGGGRLHFPASLAAATAYLSPLLSLSHLHVRHPNTKEEVEIARALSRRL